MNERIFKPIDFIIYLNYQISRYNELLNTINKKQNPLLYEKRETDREIMKRLKEYITNYFKLHGDL